MRYAESTATIEWEPIARQSLLRRPPDIRQSFDVVVRKRIMTGSRTIVSLPLAVSLLLTAATADDATQPRASVEARTFVEQLVARDYEKAVRSFDVKMTDAMSANQLRDAWNSLPARVGAFQEIVGINLVRKGKYDIALVTCQFEKGQLDVKVVYDPEGRISGLWFSPTVPPESPPPPYADPESFTEEEVTVGSGWWALPGTLTAPKGEGPFPAVVLVHGSGPNDRDETIGPNKPFRDLAWGLATRGIAVLRYEKRTKHHQLKMLLLANSLTVKEETVDDALAAVCTLRAAKNIDAKRIFVLGHSLGGMLIPRIARGDESLAGFIVFAGTSRPFEDVLLEQIDYVLSLEEGPTEQDRETLEKLRASVARVKSPDLSKDTPASELPLGIPASYWLDLRGYEPAKEAAELTRPLLILQAGRDYQVTMDDYQIWEQALSGKQNVQFRLSPKCNHLFIEGEGQCTPSEYEIPGHVAKPVVDAIAQWIQQQN